MDRADSTSSSRMSFACGVVNGSLVAVYSPSSKDKEHEVAPVACPYRSRDVKRPPSKAAAREKKLAVVTAAADALRQAKAADMGNEVVKKCPTISQAKVISSIKRKRTSKRFLPTEEVRPDSGQDEVAVNFSGFESHDDDFAKENKGRRAKRIRHLAVESQLSGTKFQTEVDPEEKDTTPCPERGAIPESIGVLNIPPRTPEPSNTLEEKQSIPILPEEVLPVSTHMSEDEMMKYVMLMLKDEANKCKFANGLDENRMDLVNFKEADTSMTETVVESTVSIRDSDCFSNLIEADDWTDLIKFDNSGDELLAGCSVDFSIVSETETLLEPVAPKASADILNELGSAMDFMMWSAASDQVHDIPILSTLAMDPGFLAEVREDVLTTTSNTMVSLSAIEKRSEEVIEDDNAVSQEICSQDEEADDGGVLSAKAPSPDAILYQCTHDGCSKTYTSKTGLK
ncbi:hypothetical protein HDU82_003754 [Entophlyctis luteolus]|nr:hypothetical protein HDU82_003754 [Entophlyctis luteolus]KAJ3392450.1 hypothetical protein HDU84_004156 [Entophlyctis sp. JEL0112]